MNLAWIGILTVLGLFFGTLILLETGRWLALRRLARDPEAAKLASPAVEGAVFGLMALLIAFTFSGAAARFDVRRTLVVEEANNIGTAWLRLDLLPEAAQQPLCEKFRLYTDSRLAFYQKLPDVAAARPELARSTKLQNEIWTGAIIACRDSGSSPATMLLLPALNQMIDITTTRTMAAQMHPPILIYIMLFLLVLAGSLLAGYGMATVKDHNWFHTFAFTLIMSLAIFVILDFEFPRMGFIRLDTFDKVLVDVRETMN